MSLDNLYSLRKEFTIIGLTGRLGSGCSQIAKLLTEGTLFTPDHDENLDFTQSESIKYNICNQYITYPENWAPYTVIEYKSVLLLFLCYESYLNSLYNEQLNYDSYVQNIIFSIVQFGDDKEFKTQRFKSEDNDLIIKLKQLLHRNKGLLQSLINIDPKNRLPHLEDYLKTLKEKDSKDHFTTCFFTEFQNFSKEFYNELNNVDPFKRSIFIHDLANCLRKSGTTEHCRTCSPNNFAIYTVAKVINQIIKLKRATSNGKSKIVIDSLKNSLELMYFKEKFSAFYMVAVKRDDEERKEIVKDKFPNNIDIANHILNLDETEYSDSDFTEGKFAGPDVINCIQKSDYHIHNVSDKNIVTKEKGNSKIPFNWQSTNSQLLKLIALIEQPGIITPTAVERTMQFAYNAKFNSGCISRQVGAVITDENFAVKSIGWNDVAKGQMPCKLRDARDLVSNKNEHLFSPYEKQGSSQNKQTKQKVFFLEHLKISIENQSDLDESLKGKPCPFCFKSFQNKLEGHDNQVHTRSLHAEENAMLQITKNGGMGLCNGKLFTTASPCELCSKKAYQIGVKEIYYIDPYPGIAMKHTLQNGVKNERTSPPTIMFKGAVGQAFHKLYEPIMSYKDEVAILSGFKPQKVALNNSQLLNQMVITDDQKAEIERILQNNQ